jgi:hypothetical protein
MGEATDGDQAFRQAYDALGAWLLERDDDLVARLLTSHPVV